MNFIKKIQQKPRSTRLLILWLASFLVMAIIVVIWLFSFSHQAGLKKAEKEAEKSNLPSLFKSIGKDFSIFKQKLEAGLKSLQIENNGQEKQQK